jgi:hypothetical protein
MSSPPLHTIFIIISIIYIFFSSRVSITRRGLITFSPTFTWGFITPFYFYIQFSPPNFYCSFYVFYTLLINFFFQFNPLPFYCICFFNSILFLIILIAIFLIYLFILFCLSTFYFILFFYPILVLIFSIMFFFYHFLNLFYFPI